MCELFAISSNVATTVRLSLGELARHGGQTAHHADGWGIAYYQERDVRVIKDVSPAATTPWIPFIRTHDLESRIAIAHLRKATHGRVAFANTQPFARELGGRMHVFAHNGDLAGIFDDPRFRPGRFEPLGDTDSELAFIDLLRRLEPLWLGTAELPAVEARRVVVAQFAAEARELGPANFIYSDSDLLFVHGHRRKQVDGSVAPPGLWRLQRTCLAGGLPDAGPVEISQRDHQEVTLFASVPLTGEAWSPLCEGELQVVADGRAMAPASSGIGQ